MLTVSLIVYFDLEFAIVSSLVGKYFNAIMLKKLKVIHLFSCVLNVEEFSYMLK